MLCSISTGKSASNWLDRLRSSRGFPAAAPDLPLDHFLDPHVPTLSNHPTAAAAVVPQFAPASSLPALPQPLSDPPEAAASASAAAASADGDKDLFGPVSNALSELFIMGDSAGGSKFCSKKSSRKQANPRIRAQSKTKSSSVGERGGDEEGASAAALPSSGDNSLAIASGARGNANCTTDGDGDEDDESCGDLEAFSRTEVTVIDTSCASWKFEKWLFRRKNVWRVREKKCKWKNVGRKKRKVSSSDDSVDDKKKARVAEVAPSLDEENKQKDGKREEACRSTDVTQVSKRRFPFSRFPRRLGVGGPPAILVNQERTGKKNGTNIPKSRIKDFQRQPKS